jgi:alkylhydroperoxidase family enzyme
LFSDAERAALRLARDSAVPNATTPAHFEDLRRHYSERQIIDLVAAISLFGFLNR